MSGFAKWFWPGLVTTTAVSALSVWFQHEDVENDLRGKAEQVLIAADYSWAQVSAEGRDLTLTGTAPTEADQFKAIELVEDVYDVRIAIDQTKLLPIQSPYKFSASSGSKGLKMDGALPNSMSREQINAMFGENYPGVVVDDQTELARGAPDGFDSTVSQSFDLLGKLSVWQYEINDGVISLSGTANNLEEFAQLNDLQQSQPAEGFIWGEISIKPPRVDGDYKTSLTKNADGITLSGFVPSVEAQSKVLSQLAEAHPDERIINNSSLASGEPDGFEAISVFLVDRFAALEEGEVELVQSNVSISGTVAADADSEEFKTGISDNLPDGLELSNFDVTEAVAFNWQARKTIDGVELSGIIPNDDARTNILARAANLFGEKNIQDTQTIGDDAPDGFANNAIGMLEILSRMQEGAIELIGSEAKLSGAVLIEQSKAVLTQQVDNLNSNNFNIATDFKVAPSPEDTPELQLDGVGCQEHLATLMQSNTILFDTGKSDIISDSYGFLDAIAYGVRRCDGLVVQISGHTDSDGDEQLNQALSEARAGAVLKHLVERGVTRYRLQAVGFGEQMPVADNSTETGKKLNRRIEFRIMG